MLGKIFNAFATYPPVVATSFMTRNLFNAVGAALPFVAPSVRETAAAIPLACIHYSPAALSLVS